MIETIICDVNDILKDNDIEKLYDELSFDIKKKIDEIKSIEKRNIDIVSWAMLYRMYNDDSIRYLDIEYNKYGKPYFKDIKDKFFSISHSREKIFVAISDKEIGVDVEYKRDDISLCMKLANRFFSDKEYEMLKKAQNKADSDCIDLFYRLWTIRESFVKCIGTGLIYDKNDIIASFDDNNKAYIEYFKDENKYQKAFDLKEIDNSDNYKYCICINDCVVK